MAFSAQPVSGPRAFLPFVLRIGASPADDVDRRLQKSLLVLCALPFAFSGFIWGLMYLAVGAPVSAAIPSSYAVFSLLSIVHFAYKRSYRFFRFSQLILILFLPFLLMLTLGGFVNGSSVILWAIICPIGAMLFEEPDKALRWFFAYLVLMVIGGFAQPYLKNIDPLSEELIIFFFVVNICAVSGLIFLMVSYFVRQKNVFQEQSESLLLNILPKAIADELKGNQHTIAEHYEGASVLFADLVDFTPMSAEMSPTELVSLLNDVFSEFDEIVEACKLEKIKTIGDCYMVAAGVPARRNDHAEILIQLALDLQDCVSRREFRGQKLQFRIGINSGPLVAGVIGQKKFIYDIWGDAVNTASRMESQGVRGCIQITKETYELVKDKFECELRGTINIKGKGETETWFVVGRKEV